MPDILHRVSIDAPPSQVHELVSTPDGVARWWTGRPVEGEAGVGRQLSVFFGDADAPAAVVRTESDQPDEVVWRVIEGPDAWIDTTISFALREEPNGATTLLFTHAGWRQASEFMSGCSTNWGAYLTSLKLGVEGLGFHAFPDGEISRWS
jgi:uncharacterized protein YndB with AHSA1/START domain